MFLEQKMRELSNMQSISVLLNQLCKVGSFCHWKSLPWQGIVSRCPHHLDDYVFYLRMNIVLFFNCNSIPKGFRDPMYVGLLS